MELSSFPFLIYLGSEYSLFKSVQQKYCLIYMSFRPVFLHDMLGYPTILFGNKGSHLRRCLSHSIQTELQLRFSSDVRRMPEYLYTTAAVSSHYHLCLLFIKATCPIKSNITCILLHFILSVLYSILDLIYALIHYLCM